MPGTKETDDLKNGKGVAGVAESEEKAPLVIQGNGASNLMARSESLHRKHVSASRQISNDVVDALPSNLSYTCWDLFYTLVSVITYVFDLVMDCAVAFYFYHLGVKHGVYHYWYCGLTITFILLPSLTMTGFSLRWYLMDADNTDLPPVPLWRWIIRVIVLMLQFAPILRYLDSIRYGLMSRQAGKDEARLSGGGADGEGGDPLAAARARERRVKYYTLMVYEDADATLLRLFECFMESAPQLVLQIYILIKDPASVSMNNSELNDDLKKTILCVSVISSLVSLAWSLVVYHRSLRYTYPDKKNLDWRGSIFQFLWHFSSITARVIALSLFASIHPKGIFAVCAAHWAVMAGWVVAQRTQACSNRCEEVLFSAVLGAIYIFSFFNAKDERTRYKYMIYYAFCLAENTALLVVWGLNTDPETWYFYPGVAGHYLAFFLGLAFMVTYYGCFHPSEIKFSIGCGLFGSRGRTQDSENFFFKGLRRISNFKLSPSDATQEGSEEEGAGEDTVGTKGFTQNKSGPSRKVSTVESIQLSEVQTRSKASGTVPDSSEPTSQREGDQSPPPMSRHLSSPADLDAPTTPDDKEDGGRPSQLSITLGAVVEDAVSSHERQRQYKKASSLPPGMPSTISRHFANYPPRSIKAMGSDRALATIADTGSQSPL